MCLRYTAIEITGCRTRLFVEITHLKHQLQVQLRLPDLSTLKIAITLATQAGIFETRRHIAIIFRSKLKYWFRYGFWHPIYNINLLLTHTTYNPVTTLRMTYRKTWVHVLQTLVYGFLSSYRMLVVDKKHTIIGCCLHRQ